MKTFMKMIKITASLVMYCLSLYAFANTSLFWQLAVYTGGYLHLCMAITAAALFLTMAAALRKKPVNRSIFRICAVLCLPGVFSISEMNRVLFGNSFTLYNGPTSRIVIICLSVAAIGFFIHFISLFEDEYGGLASRGAAGEELKMVFTSKISLIAGVIITVLCVCIFFMLYSDLLLSGLLSAFVGLHASPVLPALTGILLLSFLTWIYLSKSKE